MFDEAVISTDISIGTKAIGASAVIEGCGAPRVFRFPLPAHLSPVEGELAALFHALEIFRLLDIHAKKVTLQTDNDAAVRVIFSLGRFRSEAAKQLTKALLRATEEMKDAGVVCGIRPVVGSRNPAHHHSREVRKTWNKLLCPNNKSGD